MADHPWHRSAARDTAVWVDLRAALDRRAAETGRRCLDIVDVGGGTGNVAVPLAGLGHRVTVVDPSPNSLAALERRAEEAGVRGLVRGVQGELSDLAELADLGAGLVPAAADLAVCHSVLEHVDEPALALAALGRIVAPGGMLSLVVANRHAVVLAKAAAGHLADARRALLDPHGRWGPADPVPRRFTAEDLDALLPAAGFTPDSVRGTRIFADLVPGAVAEQPGSAEALQALEAAAGAHPAFRAIATHLHAVARRN